ncbi:MAG: AIR synthase-related protein, partial [Acidobacteriota bacterium]|nr:AIR synthase-related protein [Acidobacteriota bacterium]
LGIAALGLRLLEQGHRLESSDENGKAAVEYRAIQRQLSGHSAKGHQYLDIASSMIDLSDGLSSDLAHICEASGVGAKLFAEKIPFTGYKALDVRIHGLTKNDLFKLALHGGEDFELLFTVPPEKALTHESLLFEPIGEITESAGRIELTRNGLLEELEPKGYTHFT